MELIWEPLDNIEEKGLIEQLTLVPDLIELDEIV